MLRIETRSYDFGRSYASVKTTCETSCYTPLIYNFSVTILDFLARRPSHHSVISTTGEISLAIFNTLAIPTCETFRCAQRDDPAVWQPPPFCTCPAASLKERARIKHIPSTQSQLFQKVNQTISFCNFFIPLTKLIK